MESDKGRRMWADMDDEERAGWTSEIRKERDLIRALRSFADEIDANGSELLAAAQVVMAYPDYVEEAGR